jgi:hypothetical protein
MGLRMYKACNKGFRWRRRRGAGTEGPAQRGESSRYGEGGRVRMIDRSRSGLESRVRTRMLNSEVLGDDRNGGGDTVL